MDAVKFFIDQAGSFFASDIGQQVISGIIAIGAAWVGKHWPRYTALYAAAMSALRGVPPEEIAANGFVTVARASELFNEAAVIKEALQKEGAVINTKNIATSMALAALVRGVKKK